MHQALRSERGVVSRARDEMLLMEDDFEREDAESQRVFKTIPKSWNIDDLRIDIEERMRIPVPDFIESEEDMKWMWVQCVIMTRPPKLEYDPNAAGWEKWRYERPKLRELYKFYGDNFRTELQNILVEYCNEPEIARSRYAQSKDYVELMDRIQNIIDTPAKLSNKLTFSGFPAFMDEETIRGTFEEFGTIVKLDCTFPEDEMKDVTGIVEFESPEPGQAAVKQWDGVDMGLGTRLSLTPIQED